MVVHRARGCIELKSVVCYHETLFHVRFDCAAKPHDIGVIMREPTEIGPELSEFSEKP